MIEIADIRAASRRIAGKVHRTPLFSSSQMGDMAGVRLHLKCESLQKTGSFKVRGALNKILSLSDEERARGLVTVSAGNHAAAVAWGARAAGCTAVVVMPTDAPQSKKDAVRGYGAEIVEHGDRATLFDKLEEQRAARGLTFVHPFDCPVVLAGAGTTGLEIAEDLPDVEVVIVPVGGGGLMGGVTSALRQLLPKVRIVAVELEEGPGLGPAIAAGKPIPVKRPNTLADGMTPPFVGALPLAIAKEAVDDIVTVTEAEIVHAMKMLMSRAKLYVEASGAAATAALLAGKVRVDVGKKTVAIVSGGNVDLSRVAALI
ncbi:MAG: threonine/serine dehydratase [Polyangiaceae bacterium]